jgi:RNA polymerase sigma-70 factor (ECF subfamily)
VDQQFSSVLASAANRDESAFAAIWRTHNASLVRYFRAFRPADAEDLASETWLAVARGLSTFVGDEKAFRAWLFTIARRRMLDSLRAERRRPLIDCRDVPERPTADAADVSELRTATYAAVQLIARLPREQAEVVLLRSVAGLDVESVARIMGKRPGTVRVLAHRGLRRLRELVEPQL